MGQLIFQGKSNQVIEGQLSSSGSYSFEFDPTTLRLCRDGRPVKVANQPLQILSVLLARPGEVVTREELHALLWPEAEPGDVEHKLNVAVSKLREALGETAEEPSLLLTIPRRGYRFMGQIQSLPNPAATLIPPGKWFGGFGVAALIVLAALISAAAFAILRPAQKNPTTTGREMLLVLPFSNASGDAGREYLSDGFTEDVIAQLGRLAPANLGIIARSTAMHYKGSRQGPQRIARELGVQMVLEGSVVVEAGRVRVSAKLVRVADQREIWRQDLNRQSKGSGQAGGETAEAIARSVSLALWNGVKTAPAHKVPANQQAYEEYLRGRYYWNKRTHENYSRAIEHFERALDVEPLHAQSYAGLADCYLLLANYGSSPEVIAKARAAAKRAVEIDPGAAEVYASLGLVAMNHDWDWVGSEKAFQRALELNANYVTAHHWYAELLNSEGRVDQALREIDRAAELDPLSPIIATDRGKILLYGRRYESAIEQLNHVIAVSPGFSEAGYYLARAYAARGRYPEALGALDHMEAARSDGMRDFKGYVLARSGRPDEARRISQELEREGKTPFYPYLGLIPFGKEYKEKALQSLELAYGKRSVFITSLKVAPELDSLRDEPRFVNVLREIGLSNN